MIHCIITIGSSPVVPLRLHASHCIPSRHPSALHTFGGVLQSLLCSSVRLHLHAFHATNHFIKRHTAPSLQVHTSSRYSWRSRSMSEERVSVVVACRLPSLSTNHFPLKFHIGLTCCHHPVLDPRRAVRNTTRSCGPCSVAKALTSWSVANSCSPNSLVGNASKTNPRLPYLSLSSLSNAYSRCVAPQFEATFTAYTVFPLNCANSISSPSTVVSTMS